jgi:FkbM family methyltransferase
VLEALRNGLKHVARRTAVGLAPRAYWRVRGMRRGLEEPELALLPSLCDATRTSLDIGANYGMYTVHLERFSRRCVAFEPNPALAASLRRGFATAVEVHAVALSDREGFAELRMPAWWPGQSTIEGRNALAARRGEPLRTVRVPTRTLDGLLPREDVGFVKIDVEGHEEAVLRGSETLLRRCRPAVLVELEERHNEGCIDRVTELFAELGHRGAALVDGDLVDLADFDAVAHQRRASDPHFTRNFLYAPPEILERVRRDSLPMPSVTPGGPQ